MLTLRSTGLASPAYANWLDYVIVEAGRTVGRVAVGTRVASRPPLRSVRAAFPHTAPTSGIDGNDLPYANQRL
jgi:hypothetical protein